MTQLKDNTVRGTYGNPTVHKNDDAVLKLGSFCSIAKGVQIILGGNHRMDWVTTFPFSILWESAKEIKGHPQTKGNVVIGNDVWIGLNVIILSGVTIGNGAVIGAGSIVVNDVGAYEIYAGNPARFIRKRFTEEQIRQLQEIQWWNFSDGKITNLLPLMLSTDIDKFIIEVKKLK